MLDRFRRIRRSKAVRYRDVTKTQKPGASRRPYFETDSTCSKLSALSRARQQLTRVDVDYMKPATSVSTLILIPGASWETAATAHAPPRRRSAVIDQFLKSNVPNWPAAASVRSASVCSSYLTRRLTTVGAFLVIERCVPSAIHASCASSRLEHPFRISRSLTMKHRYRLSSVGYRSSVERSFVRQRSRRA